MTDNTAQPTPQHHIVDCQSIAKHALAADETFSHEFEYLPMASRMKFVSVSVSPHGLPLNILPYALRVGQFEVYEVCAALKCAPRPNSSDSTPPKYAICYFFVNDHGAQSISIDQIDFDFPFSAVYPRKDTEEFKLRSRVLVYYFFLEREFLTTMIWSNMGQERFLKACRRVGERARIAQMKPLPSRKAQIDDLLAGGTTPENSTNRPATDRSSTSPITIPSSPTKRPVKHAARPKPDFPEVIDLTKADTRMRQHRKAMPVPVSKRERESDDDQDLKRAPKRNHQYNFNQILQGKQRRNDDGYEGLQQKFNELHKQYARMQVTIQVREFETYRLKDQLQQSVAARTKSEIDHSNRVDELIASLNKEKSARREAEYELSVLQKEKDKLENENEQLRAYNVNLVELAGGLQND